jgi:ABC-type enterobactin transport system permease subunit
MNREGFGLILAALATSLVAAIVVISLAGCVREVKTDRQRVLLVGFGLHALFISDKETEIRAEGEPEESQ